MSKRIKIIFIVSILLNVLFIGIMIGHFSKRAAMRETMKADMKETIAHLPEEKQELILSAMKKLRGNTRGTKVKADRARKELVETLTAPQFDPERFDNEVEEMHELFGVLTRSMASTVVELAKQLNREEREALAAFIEKARSHRRHGGPPGMRPERYRETDNHE